MPREQVTTFTRDGLRFTLPWIMYQGKRYKPATGQYGAIYVDISDVREGLSTWDFEREYQLQHWAKNLTQRNEWFHVVSPSEYRRNRRLYPVTFPYVRK